MYVLSIAGGPTLKSAEVARLVVKNRDGHPHVMRHLSAIEHIEARGITYANQDIDVLSSAYSFACDREAKLGREIRQWRADIALMGDARSRTAILVYAWNWATNPAKLTTDRESRVLGKFARSVMRRLEVRSGWCRSDSGRLCC